MTNDVLTKNIHIESMRYAQYSIFQEGSLQVTYGYLLVQASYSQSDQFFKQCLDRLNRLQRATQVL